MSKYIFMVFTGACSYGILSTLVKLSYHDGFTASQLSFVQAILGAIILWVIVLIQKKRSASNKQEPNINWKTGPLLLLTGSAIGMTTFLYYLSVKYIPASIAIILLMQFTWMTILMDWILFKNKPGIKLLITVACILIGTILATGGTDSIKVLSLKGIIIALLSAFLYALYIIANSRIGKNIASTRRSAIMVSGAAAVIFIVNCNNLTGGIPYNFSFFKWTSLLALFGTIIPPLLFAKGIPKIGASLSSILMVMEMPVAILCASLVLAEPIHDIQWTGIIVMLCSIIYLNISNSSK
jgi:drug/metabolite transporter (DMT)-like permease